MQFKRVSFPRVLYAPSDRGGVEESPAKSTKVDDLKKMHVNVFPVIFIFVLGYVTFGKYVCGYAEDRKTPPPKKNIYI